MSHALRIMIIRIMLIATLAFTFAWFGLSKFLRPVIWGSWIPPWMDGLLGTSGDAWLKFFGVTEIIIAVLMVLPRKIRIVGASLAAIHLVGVLIAIGFNDIFVRDLVLLAAALSLILLSFKE